MEELIYRQRLVWSLLLVSATFAVFTVVFNIVVNLEEENADDISALLDGSNDLLDLALDDPDVEHGDRVIIGAQRIIISTLSAQQNSLALNAFAVAIPFCGLLTAATAVFHMVRIGKLRDTVEAAPMELAPLITALDEIAVKMRSGKSQLDSLASDIEHAQALASLSDEQAKATRREFDKIQRTPFAKVLIAIGVVEILAFGTAVVNWIF